MFDQLDLLDHFTTMVGHSALSPNIFKKYSFMTNLIFFVRNHVSFQMHAKWDQSLKSGTKAWKMGQKLALFKFLRISFKLK